jgi:FkbM family methyltransferase
VATSVDFAVVDRSSKVNMSIFSDDYISTCVQLGPNGRHAINEGLTYCHAQRVIAPGDKVLDLGGNQGDLTAPFAEWVGAAGLVHVFEPNPQHWSRLLAIGANVRLWPFAAGDSMAIHLLSVPDGLHGWASLNDLKALLPDSTTFVRRTTISVPISDLEEVCRSLPTFIKIDVEEFEIHALNGLKSIIIQAQPVIIFENLTAAISAFFDRVDYRIYDMFGRPADHPVKGIANQVAVPAARSIANVVSCGQSELGLLERARVLD